MSRENKYWPDNWSEVLSMEDSKPVRYSSLARRTKDDEPELAKRIKELTGYAVRFGDWEQFEIVGKDFESASEVELFVVDSLP